MLGSNKEYEYEIRIDSGDVDASSTPLKESCLRHFNMSMGTILLWKYLLWAFQISNLGLTFHLKKKVNTELVVDRWTYTQKDTILWSSYGFFMPQLLNILRVSQISIA